MELSNKVAYLKGLMEGLKIDDSTSEGKILKVMADILDEMAVCVEDIADEVDEVVDIVDQIDEDLGDIEEEVYFGDEDDFDDEDYDDCDDDDCCCDDDYDFDDEPMYECVCPTCGDSVYLDEALIEEGSIECPNCAELLEFDCSELEDEE